MTRKQIKNTASEAALRMMFRSDIHPSQQGEALFIEGAEWRINSVWHKPEEVPEAYATLLVKCIEGYRAWALWPTHVRDWRSLVETKRVVCWAYIDDLIPTEDERDS